jgi:hypothetical protein
MECVISKRNLLGSNHLLQHTKQKKTESKSKDAPRIIDGWRVVDDADYNQ